MTEVLVISISNPILIGIYKNENLIKEYKLEGKTSDLLPQLFEKILKEYDIDRLNYVNTPGSYMAIKVSYVFLKTVSITKNIELRACSGFEFNENSPIKALGKKYFIQDENEIKVDFLEKDCIIRDFELPKSIDKINFNKQTLPIYNLPAV
ncbi:hypothetical protein [Arcobacter roscoffensis]|uniref:Glycoprotease n=1 Tax=Arcobacter roscoffensis TaxID=2961520 RepID=A0ABY5E7Y9_9BACT|nr:hypothetical protein [Arcobacter roscoffensis]UTJ06866.1 hypothetical protein NJU99_01900 [Arcobacter roscoffensis]